MRKHRYSIHRIEGDDSTSFMLYDGEAYTTKIISTVYEKAPYQYGKKTVYKVLTEACQMYVAHDTELCAAYIWVTDEEWSEVNTSQSHWLMNWQGFSHVENVRQWLGADPKDFNSPRVTAVFEAVF